MGGARTAICIPTYNERENLPSLIEEILATTDADLIVVDDDSPDGTGRVADVLAQSETRLSVIHRTRKEGLGRAYIEGFRRALSSGYDMIFQMDADFSHQPRYLPEMMAALRNADVVVGSRYVSKGGIEHWGIARRVVSRASNFYARRVLSMSLRDATAGFAGFRRGVLEAIDLENIRSEGYAFQIELKYRAHQRGFTIIEVPIVFFDRVAGASKMSKRTIAQAMLRVLELRLRRRWNPPFVR